MIFLVASLSLCVVSTVLFVKYMTANHGVLKKMGIKHEPTSWFFGNFNQIFQHGLFDVQRVFYKKFSDQKVYGWYDTRSPVLIVKDLDIIKDICVKHFNCFVDRQSLFEVDPPFCYNLLNLKGDHWKQVRSIVTPTFTSGRLKRMSAHIQKNSVILLDTLKKYQESGEEVELKLLSSYFTLDVIASTGFGLEINTLKEPKNKFATEAQKLINPNPLLFTLVLFIPALAKVFSRFGLPILPKNTLKYFSDVVDQVIEQRKRDGMAGKVNDFLDLVMEAESDEGATTDKKLTHEELQAQASIFIFAGYETVATVLSFTLFFLTMNPECLRKAQKEVEEKCVHDFPSYDEVQTLTYLDMCISESMRLAPPGFMINRQCVEETVIDGIRFPKNISVVIPVYALHHDPEVYPEPEKFDPERFSAENKAGRHPCAYLPFGQGPRNCVGMRLALVELKMVLAAILQKFTPVSCRKSIYPIKLNKVQMKADDGLWVKFLRK